MTRTDLDNFEKISGQLVGVYEEISLLSKKNPNDAVNKFKLSFINNILEKANTYLGDHYRPFTDFSLFDSDSVPQNSDVVFIITQYLQSFEKFRADNTYDSYGKWFWKVKPNKGEKAHEDGYIHIATAKPKNLKE